MEGTLTGEEKRSQKQPTEGKPRELVGEREKRIRKKGCLEQMGRTLEGRERKKQGKEHSPDEGNGEDGCGFLSPLE